MEKVIEIKIHNNHDIEVKLDSKQKLLIPKNNREINAEKIYESLEFNKNDSYRLLELESLVLESVGKESKVVKALYDLYSNIISSVNEVTKQNQPVIIINNDINSIIDETASEEKTTEKI